MNVTETLINQGYVITRDLISPDVIEKLLVELENIGAFDYDQVQNSNLLSTSKAAKDIAYDSSLLALLTQISGQMMFPVKAFILDKSMTSNWEIPWHQDLAIAVEEYKNLPGYTNWSVEVGIPHVHPPAEVLNKLITLRIHLDQCTIQNSIHAIAGSHQLGVLSGDQMKILIGTSVAEICIAPKNSVMLMRPLLVHYSPMASSSNSRRILQIEYGYELSNGLLWHKS